jgi:hypothetical protein
MYCRNGNCFCRIGSKHAIMVGYRLYIGIKERIKRAGYFGVDNLKKYLRKSTV